MSMENSQKESLDLLESPLWGYISVAANEKFTSKEKYCIMMEHMQWEKEHRKTINELKKLVKNP